jgi:exosome complex component RRP42
LTAVVPGEREGRGEDMPMPIRDMPVSVTLVDIGGEMMIDPDLDEETVCDTRITIVSNQDGSISGMQKSGDGALTEEKLLKAVSLACQKASELREAHLLNI